MEVLTADDEIDRTRGSVYAQKMATLPAEYQGSDGVPLNLYYDTSCEISGWIEGFWDDAGQEFLTITGHAYGTPTAWAVLPKTPEDWV